MIQTSARLLRVLGLLQGGRIWTAPQLGAELDVHVRTVRRDVDRLRELGYPVLAQRGVEGGYRLGAAGTLPPLLLDPPEAMAVAIGLQSAAVASVAGMTEAADRALAKLEKVLPPAVRTQVAAIHAGVVTVPDGAIPVSGADVTAVLVACDRRVRLRFDYPAADATVARDVEPHRLVQAGRRWYLLAWDVDRADWRTFRLDRMTELRPSTFIFTERHPPEDAATMVSRGIASAPYRFQARVLVDCPAAVLADLVPATVGLVIPEGADRSVLLTGSDSLMSIALYVISLDKPAVVLEPKELTTLLGEVAERFALIRSGSIAAG